MRNRIILPLLAGSALLAQSTPSIWDGIYTADQADSGKALYAKDCASCHADDLMGSGQAPELAGNDFRKEWNGQSVADLFDRMSTSMPGDRPGALSANENADILAFMLKSNGYPAGTMALKGEMAALRNIPFEAVKGKK